MHNAFSPFKGTKEGERDSEREQVKMPFKQLMSICTFYYRECSVGYSRTLLVRTDISYDGVDGNGLKKKTAFFFSKHFIRKYSFSIKIAPFTNYLKLLIFDTSHMAGFLKHLMKTYIIAKQDRLFVKLIGFKSYICKQCIGSSA